MLPVVTTLQHLKNMLAEQKRILIVMRNSYPQQVKDSKLSPYERDYRFYCINNTISLIEHNIANELKNNLCNQQQQQQAH